MTTDEPAVLTWMIALAPRPRPAPVGGHWWRQLVMEHFRAATDAWERQREAAGVGYDTETAAWEADHPAPRLADFMLHLSSGKQEPGKVFTF